MPTYISLVRWTSAGTEKLKHSPARLEAARQGLLTGGVKLISFYLTMGSHDMVVIAEAPNDEAIAVAMLSLVATGAVVTQTSRAFTEEEYHKIFSSLP